MFGLEVELNRRHGEVALGMLVDLTFHRLVGTVDAERRMKGGVDDAGNVDSGGVHERHPLRNLVFRIGPELQRRQRCEPFLAPLFAYPLLGQRRVDVDMRVDDHEFLRLPIFVAAQSITRASRIAPLISAAPPLHQMSTGQLPDERQTPSFRGGTFVP